MDASIKDYIQRFAERSTLKGMSKAAVKAEVYSLEEFFSRLEKKSIYEVTREDIENYIEEIKHKFKRNTLNRKICRINKFFSFLKEEGELLLNPASRVEPLRKLPDEKRTRPEIFTEDEIKRMIDSAGGSIAGIRDRAILEVFYSSGLRLSELIGLDLGDIDFRAKEILVKNGKGGKERLVPVGGEALKAVEEYLSERHHLLNLNRKEDKALFLSEYGKRLSRSALKSRLKRWKTKAGVKTKGGCHALRRSMASHLLEHGAGSDAIQKMLGHDSLSTTQKYLHIKH